MDKIIKTTATCAGAIVAYLFGGWDALLGITLAFVTTDYMTGVIAAAIEGKLASNVGYKGIARKVMIFVMIALAHLIDQALGLDRVLMTATIFFYLANEILSIVENIGRIGLPVPKKLLKAIAMLKEMAGEDDEN